MRGYLIHQQSLRRKKKGIAQGCLEERFEQSNPDLF